MQKLKGTILLFSLVLAMGYQATAMAIERWYRVELLVVEHKDKSGILLEEWPLDPGYPETRRANYVQKITDEEKPDNFIELENDDLDLLQARKSLVQRTGNKVLLHKGWRQLVREDDPEPVRLTAGKVFNYKPDNSGRSFDLMEVDGTITIQLSRYLHVLTDLVFHKPMEILKQESSYEHNQMQKLKPLANEKNWESIPNAAIQRFRLHEQRKLKKNDVIYIDHPLYGVLIKVSDDKKTG